MASRGAIAVSPVEARPLGRREGMSIGWSSTGPSFFAASFFFFWPPPGLPDRGILTMVSVSSSTAPLGGA